MRLVDKAGRPLKPGDKIFFRTRKGNTLKGRVAEQQSLNLPKGKLTVFMGSDPFSIDVLSSKVEKAEKSLVTSKQREGDMTPPTEAVQLRMWARDNNIEGWDTMSRDQLRKAKAAHKSSSGSDESGRSGKETTRKRSATRSSRRVPATKTTASKRREERAAVKKRPADGKRRTSAATNGVNPYRPNSNMRAMAEKLIRGGKRKDIARELRKTIDVVPYHRDPAEMDMDAEIDKRVMLTAADLEKKHGFTVITEGRGLSGTIKAVPGNGKAPRKATRAPERASQARKPASKGSRASKPAKSGTKRRVRSKA